MAQMTSTQGRAAPASATRPVRRARAGPDRRSFLRGRGWRRWGAWLASFGGASIGFMWPSLRGGFGAVVELGSQQDVLRAIEDGGGRYELPAGRMYLVAYDASADPDGQYAEVTNGAPFMALYQKCPHLGCRVPWCASSSWFECPCHGSRYNRWGEYQFGPAPRAWIASPWKSPTVWCG